MGRRLRFILLAVFGGAHARRAHPEQGDAWERESLLQRADATTADAVRLPLAATKRLVVSGMLASPNVPFLQDAARRGWLGDGSLSDSGVLPTPVARHLATREVGRARWPTALAAASESEDVPKSGDMGEGGGDGAGDTVGAGEETAIGTEKRKAPDADSSELVMRRYSHEGDSISSSITTRAEARAENGSPRNITLPAAWVRNFVEGSLFLTNEGLPTSASFTGKALVHGTTKLSFSARSATAPGAASELRALEVMSPTGCVHACYEAQQFSDTNFMLTERIASTVLDLLIDECLAKGTSDSSPVMSPSESLPVLIDMLRALAHMEDAGLVHGDITERNIKVEGMDGHALITNFHSSCFPDAEDPELHCDRVGGPARGSVYRLAPEVAGGGPVTPKNNVWQLGLVFAKMNFGVLPTEKWVTKNLLAGQDARQYENTPEGHDAICEQIAESFDIHNFGAFKRLSKKNRDLMDILVGMLEKDPEYRWTAKYALERALLAASKHEAPVLGRRTPAELPRCFSETPL
mmetsp:Transcript_12294/g.35347  ORF Transcript_12294/g.35347 Transcript_12294/m.35347 type:complete len:524 (+) Transcript_12294:110-1681(+)